MHPRAARVSIGAASSTCSKLSSTSSARRPRREATSASSDPRPGLSTRPSAPAIVVATSVGVADRSELDEHHAARELGVEACCRLDREPRLSRSGRSRQRQETHVWPRPAARGSPAAPGSGRRRRSIALAASVPAGRPEPPARRPAPDPDRGSPARGGATPTPARSRAARPAWPSPPGRRPAPPPACPSGRARA